MLDNEDRRRVVETARLVQLSSNEYIDSDLVTSLISTVVDFQMQTAAVVKALNHYQTRWKYTLRTLNDLEELLLSYPNTKVGNTELAIALVNYKVWTRAGLLRSLVDYLRDQGVDDFNGLRAWAARSEFHRDFEGRVRYIEEGRTYGLGPAVFNWLVMRLGIETVKPDVHLHRFVETALKRRVSDADPFCRRSRHLRRLFSR